MTLKEKFENNITEIQGNIKIADEFAIGFAIWIYDFKGNINNVKELLGIYKKEKGL